MAGRLTVLPDTRLLALRPALLSGLREVADSISGEVFADFFDRSMRGLLVDGFNRVGAHEGTVWILDAAREVLIPRFNSGPQASQFVGSYRQSLRNGMISMVVAIEQPICENDVMRNQRQDRTLDERLGLQTCAMLAVPFFYVGELRGVISCVQLKAADSRLSEPPGFSAEHLHGLQLTAGVLSRLIEYRLLTLCLGVEDLA